MQAPRRSLTIDRLGQAPLHGLRRNRKTPPKPPVSTDSLRGDRVESSFPSLSFFVLLTTSTVIATLGLLVDSPAVVIGAMIVAPLMNPILSCAYGISTSDRLLIQRSLLTIALGSATVMLLAWAVDVAVPATILSQEIIARTTPNIVDLVNALAAGAAPVRRGDRSRPSGRCRSIGGTGDFHRDWKSGVNRRPAAVLRPP